MIERVVVVKEAGGNWRVPVSRPGFRTYETWISTREAMIEFEARLRAEGKAVVYCAEENAHHYERNV